MFSQLRLFFWKGDYGSFKLNWKFFGSIVTILPNRHWASWECPEGTCCQIVLLGREKRYRALCCSLLRSWMQRLWGSLKGCQGHELCSLLPHSLSGTACTAQGSWGTLCLLFSANDFQEVHFLQRASWKSKKIERQLGKEQPATSPRIHTCKSLNQIAAYRMLLNIHEYRLIKYVLLEEQKDVIVNWAMCLQNG